MKKFLKTADEKFKELGFTKDPESNLLWTSYIRKDKEYNYIQNLDIGHKKNINGYIVQSFEYLYDENNKVKDECHVVGITEKEMKVCLQKIKELKKTWKQKKK